MAEIKYEVVKHIGVLMEGSKGWTKELNLISWNDRKGEITTDDMRYILNTKYKPRKAT